MDGCGWLWEIMGDCGWLCVVVGGCVWLWVVVCGCGWLWLVAYFSITHRLTIFEVKQFSRTTTDDFKWYLGNGTLTLNWSDGFSKGPA